MVVHQTAERGLGFGLEEEPKLRVLKPILRDALALYVHRAHTRTPKPMHEFGVDKKAGEMARTSLSRRIFMYRDSITMRVQLFERELSRRHDVHRLKECLQQQPRNTFVTCEPSSLPSRSPRHETYGRRVLVDKVEHSTESGARDAVAILLKNVGATAGESADRFDLVALQRVVHRCVSGLILSRDFGTLLMQQPNHLRIQANERPYISVCVPIG